MSEDSDIAALFAGKREASRVKRASNRERGEQHLADAKIPFVSKNNGAHLIIMDRINYWPGTGLWQDRMTPSKGRGVRRLLDYVRTLV